jgi:hypothetical protein
MSQQEERHNKQQQQHLISEAQRTSPQRNRTTITATSQETNTQEIAS